jgi:flagellar biosynthesis protein FlhG
MADQADRLRTLMEAREKDSNYDMRIITISSGKGGVGKTSLTVNLAIALSKKGKKVMIMDADLGMANVDIMLGLVPRYTLYDVLQGQKTLSEIIVQGCEGVSIIPGCSGLFDVDNVSRLHKEGLIRALNSYAQKMDYILIDTGAGISNIVLGFIAAADDVVIVITPEPTSITDGYGIIKILSKFQLHQKVFLIVNMVANMQEAHISAGKIEAVAKKYLNIKIDRLGVIYTDNNVKKSIKQMTPFIVEYPKSQASKDVMQIADNILKNKIGFPTTNNNFAHKLINLLR